MYYVPNDAQFFNGNARAANLWNSNRLNESGAILWDHTFTPTLINEARFNVTRWYFNELATNPQEPFGLPTDNINLFGNVPGNQISFGAPGPGRLLSDDLQHPRHAHKNLGQTLDEVRR